METIADLNNILSRRRIENELDFERASIINRKLRTLAKEHPELIEKRNRLRGILNEYEKRVWVEEEITDEKIADSGLAEAIAERERFFLHKRKLLIKEKLQSLSLSQKDLAKLLGHKSITHVSELINGVNSFTTHDLVVIHLLLKIDFNDLIPAVLDADDLQKLTSAISQLSNPRLKINARNFALIAE